MIIIVGLFLIVIVNVKVFGAFRSNFFAQKTLFKDIFIILDLLKL